MSHYYAIRRKKDKKLVSGTDFNYAPPRQIMVDDYRTPKLFVELELSYEIPRRHINLKYYEIIEVYILQGERRESDE